MSDDDRLENPAQYARLPAGKIIGGYRIESVIGEGAHSVVYLASRVTAARVDTPSPDDPSGDPPTSDQVALKVIHRHLCGDPQIFQRFHREAEILTRLHGEHIVKLFDFIEEDGLLTIALEYVEGPSLEARLREGPVTVDEAVEITLQICAALGSAHAAGIIHRDLKPANVLVTEVRGAPSAGGGPARPVEIRVKVLDFGLARLVQGKPGTTNLTQQGMIFGTPEYMAPEQARGDEADARSDLYAAGVMLFEMAVGELPFKGRSAIGAMAAHLSEAPPSPRARRPDGRISLSLEAIILRAMGKDPIDRYPTARAFAEAIASVGEVSLVLNPPRDVDIAQLGTGDTDLNVPPPSLATAKTVPTMEIPAETRAALDRNKAEIAAAAEVAQATQAALAVAPTVSLSAHPRLTATTSIPDTLQSAVYDPPHRSRWLWAVVAIVAAAIGVVIGAIAGTR
ncbi:MAG: serine/threonine-protein kinase [Byssovorax sp.]